MSIISDSMRPSRRICFANYVLLLCVFMSEGLVGCQGLFSNSARAVHTLKDEDMTTMVEKLFLDCGLNIWDMKETAENLRYSLLEESIHDLDEMHMKERLFYHFREVISSLFPETEQTFLACLSKQHLSSLTSGNENDKGSWYVHYLQLFLGWHTTSRRSLIDQSTPSIIRSLQSDPDVLAPAPLLSTRTGNPSAAPGSHKFPPQTIDESSPGGNSDLPLRKQNDSKRPIVLAVIFSITGTSLLAALFFVIYKRRLRNHYLSYSQRVDRPFLSLSKSDFSGSSPMSFGFRNSVENKMEPFSSKVDLVQNGDIAYAQAASVVAQTPNVSITSNMKQQSIEHAASNAPLPPTPPVMAPPMQQASAAPAPPPPPPLPKASPSPASAPPPPVPPAPKSASPAPPPPPPNKKPGVPPPPKAAIAPRPPQANLKPFRQSPLGSKQPEKATSGEDLSTTGDTSVPRAKLKPFFWDKVAANPDHSMVWNQLKSGSFQFSEEMIEALFGYTSANKPKIQGKEEAIKHTTQAIRILDPKKSQNLAISLKALNVKIEEVCDALMEGNELPIELLQILLKMPPTSDEELRLRLYDGDPSQLGSAEQFLKALVNIPSAYKRLDALLFMSILPEEVSGVKESLSTLEAACGELKNSRLFLKLLEAVLKTGNRMNNGTLRGGAQAFKLDTLLKLSDVKGADGKTTLLHFVVQEIIRSEGIRAFRATRQRSGSISSIKSNDSDDCPLEESEDYYRKLGLKVVSSLSDELENVKKAAGIDADALMSTVATLGHRLLKLKEFLDTAVKNMEVDSGFLDSLKGFIEHTETNIVFLLEEEKRIRLLVKKTTDFFHGNAAKNEGLRLFVIVRDFLVILDKACKEVREAPPPPRKVKENPKPQIGETSTKSVVPDPRQLIFPRIRDRRLDDSSSSSSDEES